MELTNVLRDARWQQQLAPEFDQPYMRRIQERVQADRQSGLVLPDPAHVFAAFNETPLDSVKVVILGQDPYPTPGNAMGLAFSVQPHMPIPASLRNIYQELISDLGGDAPVTGDLRGWARQGVLLLNTALTVRAHEAGSHHAIGWQHFTDAAIRVVNRQCDHAVFVLWGKHAQTKRKLIDDQHLIIESAHPSPLAAYRGFFGSKPFSQINAQLAAWQRSGIDWHQANVD